MKDMSTAPSLALDFDLALVYALENLMALMLVLEWDRLMALNEYMLEFLLVEALEIVTE